MALFEPVIVEVHLYCNNEIIRIELDKAGFKNIEVKRIDEFRSNKSFDVLDFSNELEYFDKEKIQSIIGEKIKNIPREILEICFIESKEDFKNLRNYKGIIIALKDDLTESFQACTIVVKDIQHALEVIRSIYLYSNSFHVFPYELGMILGDKCIIEIENIDTLQLGNFQISIWHYRNSSSEKICKVVFINTKEDSIRNCTGSDLDNKVVEIIDRLNLNSIDDDVEFIMNYSVEIK